MITIKKNPTPKDPSSNKEKKKGKKRGRPTNNVFDFGNGIPLQGFYHQALRSKHPTTRYIGRLPSIPTQFEAPSIEEDPEAHRSWMKKANKFSFFWLTTLRAEVDRYNKDSTIRYNYDWSTFVQWVRSNQNSTKLMDQYRLQIMNNAITAFRIDKTSQQLQMAYRNRNRDHWNDLEKKKFTESSLFNDTMAEANAYNDENDECVDETVSKRELQCMLKQFETADSYAKTIHFLTNEVITKELNLNTTKLDHIIQNNKIPLYNERTITEIEKIAEKSTQLERTPELSKSLHKNPFDSTPFPIQDIHNNLTCNQYLNHLKHLIDKFLQNQGLSPDKMIFLHHMRDYFCSMKTLEHFPSTPSIEKALERNKWWLSGPPGSGKTYAIFAVQAIVRKLELGTDVNVTFMNVAAQQFDGTTFHSFFSIPIIESRRKEESSEHSPIKPLSVEKLQALRIKTGGKIAIIIIDESSQAGARNVATIQQRIEQAYPGTYETIAILFVGDFNQNKPPGATSLASGFVAMFCFDYHIHRNGIPTKDVPIDSPIRTALNLFASASRFELTEQQRSHDPLHSQFLLQAYNNGKFTTEQLQQLKPLTANDYHTDPSWCRATMIVITNTETKLFQHYQSILFAKATGQFVFRWKMRKVDFLKIKDPKSTSYNPKHPFFWQYFVANANAFISDKVSPTLSIFNGTIVRYHSLSFSTRSEEQEFQRLCANKPFGSVIDLDFHPATVNVQIFPDFETNDQSDLRRIVTSRGCTIIDNNAIIPIQPKATKQSIQQTIPYGPTATKIKPYPFFPVDPSFSTTSQKCQSRTMTKIIIALSRPKKQTYQNTTFDFAQLFTALTRVRQQDDIRVLYSNKNHDFDEIKYLQEKVRPISLTYLLDSYDQYDHDLEQLNLHTLRMKCLHHTP